MFDRVAGSTFKKAPHPAASLIILVLLWSVVGCGTLRDFGLSVGVSHPVWMADGWVYYLREENSKGDELWRQRGSQEEGERFMGTQDIATICNGATFSFLFRATDNSLGIAIECEGPSTELVMYSLQRETFNPLASTPFLGGVALEAGKATGYVQLPTECGVAIKPIRDGVVGEFAKPITISGKSWMLSGAQRPNCGSVAWAHSPVLTSDGNVYFLAAPGSIGQLPIVKSEVFDGFEWYLCSWDGHDDAPRVVAKLRGFANLAVSPDGQFVIVALADDPGGIVVINTATGKETQIIKNQRAYEPSLSPDITRLVYAEDLQQIRFVSLPDAIP